MCWPTQRPKFSCAAMWMALARQGDEETAATACCGPVALAKVDANKADVSPSGPLVVPSLWQKPVLEEGRMRSAGECLPNVALARLYGARNGSRSVTFGPSGENVPTSVPS